MSDKISQAKKDKIIKAGETNLSLLKETRSGNSKQNNFDNKDYNMAEDEDAVKIEVNKDPSLNQNILNFVVKPFNKTRSHRKKPIRIKDVFNETDNIGSQLS